MEILLVAIGIILGSIPTYFIQERKFKKEKELERGKIEYMQLLNANKKLINLNPKFRDRKTKILQEIYNDLKYTTDLGESISKIYMEYRAFLPIFDSEQSNKIIQYGEYVNEQKEKMSNLVNSIKDENENIILHKLNNVTVNMYMYMLENWILLLNTINDKLNN